MITRNRLVLKAKKEIMNKKLLWLVLAVVLVLFALWPSNTFAHNMGQKIIFPGLAKYPDDGRPYPEGGTYSGTLWTYWWEKDCGPGSDTETEWLCFDRLSTLFGWRITSPKDALVRVDLTASNSPYRGFYLAVLPEWGDRYPDFASIDIQYSRWDIWMSGFPDEAEGNFLVLDAHLWGKFLPESCYMPGLYLGLDLGNGRIHTHVVPCMTLHSELEL